MRTAGVLIASSFGWATARDWARFGLLYAYDGMWWDAYSTEGARRTTEILPPGWVEFSRTPAPTSRNV